MICEICGEKATVTDHDHATGRVRGRLCQSCNVTLGRLENGRSVRSEAWIKLARFYLEKPQGERYFPPKSDAREVGLRLPGELVDDLKEMADGVPLATFIKAQLGRDVRDWKAAREKKASGR